MNLRLFKDWIRRFACSAVAGAAIVTVVRAAGFLLVLGYALRKLPPAEIGLWYVMSTIAGMAGIIELGFGGTLSRYASYYAAGVATIPRLGVGPGVGELPPNVDALAGLVLVSRRLYRVFGALVGAIMLVAWLGWLRWGSAPNSVTLAHSLWFLFFAAGTALNMTGSFWPAMVFGLNHVRSFNGFTLWGLIVDYGAAFLILVAGGGIEALIAGQLLVGFVPRFLARRLVTRLLKDGQPSAAPALTWVDLWPMSWRSGAVGLSSFICLQGTVYLCSFYADLRTTACYGFSMQLAVMLHGFSAIWLWVKHPEISLLRGRGDGKAASRVFWTRLPLSLASYAVGAVLSIPAMRVLLNLLGSQTDLLPAAQLVALFGVVGLDLVVGHHSAILQTGNEAPHLKAGLLSAGLTLSFVAILAPVLGVWGIILAPVCAQLPFNYWWTPMLCWRRLLGSEAPLAPSG